MTFFVNYEDGRREGPVDDTELAEWAQSGRITPLCTLENVLTHQVMLARDHPAVQSVLGTTASPASAPGRPVPGGPRIGTGVAPGPVPGSTEALLAIIFSVLGILTCSGGILLGPVALFLAYRAGLKGRDPLWPMVLATISLSTGILGVMLSVLIQSPLGQQAMQLLQA